MISLTDKDKNHIVHCLEQWKRKHIPADYISDLAARVYDDNNVVYSVIWAMPGIEAEATSHLFKDKWDAIEFAWLKVLEGCTKPIGVEFEVDEPLLNNDNYINSDVWFFSAACIWYTLKVFRVKID